MASALEALSEIMASLLVAWAYARKSISHLSPYIYIKFPEFSDSRLDQCEVFIAVQNYLSRSASAKAKWLKVESIKESGSLLLGMDEDEEIVDHFEGVKLWWSFHLIPTHKSTIRYPSEGDQRYFQLRFHQRHRELVNTRYMKHVVEMGKEVAASNRKRKLFTNNVTSKEHRYMPILWSNVAFKHPSTFDTLAMDPIKKMEIKNDLLNFQRGKAYYEHIGKAWQRGYLLYGPPGTGKSTMIAAMANLLNYDVYDVELTTVKDNTELKKLLIGTSEKSIIVIEDIDCSLDLTGQRKTKKQKKDEKETEEESQDSKVTLSGLLNFSDGLWSACRGERIIVFTTNFVEKLDPALVRRGRMDMHIEMKYCCFESFKLLARNYLGVESDPLFPRVRQLLEETEMTPADVTENLIRKSEEEDKDARLERLIEALEKAKVDARKKSEDEEKAAIAAAAAEAEAKATAARAMAEKEVKENGVL